MKTCKRGHPRNEKNTYIIPSTGAHQCRACRKESTKAYWLAHPGKKTEKQRRLRNQRHQRLRETDPDKLVRLNKRRRLRQKYDLTIDQYDALYLKQMGLCAICDVPDPTLDVDHCHETNTVRGLLCNGCNVGLAKFRDDVDLLERASQYLQAAVRIVA